MVTLETLKEAQKLLAVALSDDALRRIATQLPTQIAQIEAVRRLDRSRDLEPGFRFDPRMPGRVYAEQGSSLTLHSGTTARLPTSAADIAYSSVTQQSHWLHTNQITSRELTEIYLERIERFNAQLRAFITVTEDLALAQAGACDEESARGQWRGPLHGIPYSLKDVFDTAGIPTTWGSSLYRDRVPAQDAAVVAKLRHAGAVLLGKDAPGELAWGATWFGGEVHNPWSLAEPAGGSSAGSGAAVAAGLCGFSLGTDALGSILSPAERCGVVGLRPTFGRVPGKGCMSNAPTLLRIGPLCRQVEDAALILQAINAPDPTSANSIDVGFSYDAGLNLRGLKVGYSPRWFERMGFGTGTGASPSAATIPVDQGHRDGLEALRRLGVELIEVELDPLPYPALINILGVEFAAVFEDLALSAQAGRLIVPAAEVWHKARLVSAVDYWQIERFRRQVMAMMDRLFERVDLLITPAYGSFDLLVATNCTGHPGISFRTGFTESAMRDLNFAQPDPAGSKHRVTTSLTIHGRLFDEGKMLALARAVEETLNVWWQQPPLAERAD